MATRTMLIRSSAGAIFVQVICYVQSKYHYQKGMRNCPLFSESLSHMQCPFSVWPPPR